MVSTTRKTAYPDATTLIELSSQMAASMKNVIDGFEHFIKSPASKPISTGVLRVGNTARILNLRSVIILADETAELARQVESGARPNGGLVKEALRGALSAIHRYLTSAALGKVASGASLYGPYVDVMAQTPARPLLSLSELFLPVSPVFGANSPTYNEGKFIAEIARYQDEYHQAMLRFGASRNIDTINALRTSLVTMETKNPPTNFRTLFSLAISFFDMALRNGGQIDPKDEDLPGRIDDELTCVVRGEFNLNEATLSWFMHAIATAPQFSTRIRTFQDTYELSRLVEEESNGVVPEQAIANAELALQNAQKAWEAAAMPSGDAQAARGTAFALLAACNIIGDYSLKILSLALGSFADGVVSGSVVMDKDGAMYGASALLAIGDRLARISQDPKGGRSVAEFHRDRIRSVLSGNSPAERSVDMSAEGDHTSAILDEVVNNISATEQIVDQCLREGVKESKVAEALKLFGMARSALLLLNLEEGAQLSMQVETHVREQMAKLIAGVADDDGNARMAEGVVLLGRYIRLVLVDPPQATAALTKGAALFAVPDLDAADIPATSLAADLPFDVCSDDELGPIFFEEANDVIDNTIIPGLEKMKRNLLDEQALTDVRRGFHTLKGSARMVDLNNLGIIGQHAEYVLNACRGSKSIQPTTDMVTWLEGLSDAFRGAIAILSSGHRAQVDVPASEEVYLRFVEHGQFSIEPIRVDHAVAEDPIFEVQSDDRDVHIPETQPFILPMHVADELTGAEELVQDFDDVAERPTVETNDAVIEDIVVEALNVNEAVPADGTDTTTTTGGFEPDTIAGHDLSFHPRQLEETETLGNDLPPIPESVASAATESTMISAGNSLQDLDMPDLPESVSSQVGSFVDGAGDLDALPPIPESLATNLSVAPESGGEVLIGEVSIPSVLYNAFIAEARNFYNDLDRMVRDLISGKSQVMEFEVMRLAHSLAGMGRTTGLFAITEIAGELEVWASITIDQKIVVTNDQAQVLKDALESLEAMIIGVEDMVEPLTDTELVQRIKQLVSDAEHFLAHGHEYGEMAESVMQRIEGGGEVSDTGVAESRMVHSPTVSAPIGASDGAVLLDSSNATFGDGQMGTQTVQDAGSAFNSTLPEVHAETFEAPPELSLLHGSGEGHQEMLTVKNQSQPVDIRGHDDDVEIHVIGDTSGSDLVEESIVSAVAAEITASTMNALHSNDGALAASEPVVEEHAEGLSFATEAPLEAVADAAGVHGSWSVDVPEVMPNDVLDIVEEPIELASHPVDISPEISFDAEGELPPTIAESELTVLESDTARDNEAIFFAPEIDHARTAIGKSQSVGVPTIQPHLGANSVTSVHSIGRSPAGLEQKPAGTISGAGANWLEMVRTKEDDIDAEMLEIFLEETQQRFTEIDAALGSLSKEVGDKRQFLILKRAIHTLKGSSNTAGARKVGALFHHLEDLMNEAPSMTVAICVTVQSGVDAAFTGIEALRQGRSVEGAIERIGRSAMISTGLHSDAMDEPAQVQDSNTQTMMPSTGGGSVKDSGSSEVNQPQQVEAPAARRPGSRFDQPNRRVNRASKNDEDDSSTLRVSAKTLDRMVKTSGEIGISRSRMAANIDLSKISMSGLAVSLERMNGYLRAIELEAEKQMSAGAEASARNTKFDSLQMDRFTRLQELTRRVAEAQNDVMTQQAATLTAVRDMAEASATQFVLLSDLSSDLDEIRQVRVSSVVPNLKRVVRAACRDTGKLGEIYFDADVEIDRGILDKIVGPIEHILRNAIVHGIEAQADRLRAGKLETGSIEFRAFQDGGEVVIEIRDDGRGIDTQQVLTKAVERGMVKPGARMTEDKVHDLLFEPGFSTAETVTDIAGRGVGLDVVRSQVSAMGGRVDVNSTLGTGTAFVLRLPATLTVIAGASVMANSHMYVVPVSFIDRLVRIGARDLDDAYKSQRLIVKDSSGETVEYDFWGMWQLMGAAAMEGRPSPRNSVLLMRGSRTAVHIDDIRPAAEFVFRPMGPQLVSSSGLIGSTINASGNATLVVDPTRVVRNLKVAATASANGTNNARAPFQKAIKTPLILIVDDSLTVRKITSRLLKREGLRHIEAENGLQALERLQEERPDVILMDIEMPVMNGYEATQAIRSNEATRDIPIVMITSRVGEQHRQRAIELGVNEYLGKPYNESDLLDLIRKYIAVKAVATV